MINIFYISIIITLTIALIISIIAFREKLKKIKNNIKIIINTIDSVRYGNLSARLIIKEADKMPALSESINKMVETIQDREKMIQEFKKEIVGHNIFLETLINSLSEGFLILNSKFVIQKMTSEATKFLGDNAEGKFLGDFILNEENLDELFKLKKFEIILKNNTDLTFLSTISELNFAGNDEFKYLMTIKNISEEKELKQVKNDFVATLAHDLRVPLLAEQKTLNLILEGKLGEINSQTKDCLSLLNNSNNEVLEITNTLLETYKLEETGLILHKETVNINQIIKDVKSEMLLTANTNGTEINLNLDNDFQFELDEFNIKRAIKNLISNSLEYAKNSQNIDIYTKQTKNGCQITIRDYGVGISEKEQQYIFQKYYSGASKFRKVGHGLGLYLVNEIVKAHSGTIEIESEPNVKTDFTIFLPNK